MDYTQSNSFDIHAATGNRMHEDSKAVPTAISDADFNGPAWELLSLIKQAGITPAGFDANTPATYQQVAAAIAALQRQQTNTAYTTGGTAPAFTVTLPASAVALAALGANLRLRLKFHAAGAGNDTLAIGSLAAKNLKQYDSTGAKVAGVIAAGQLVDVEYDGTDFVLLDPLPTSLAAMGFSLIKSGYGYQKLPGGLIFQWGTSAGSSSGVLTYNFPIAFPVGCVSLLAQVANITSSNTARTQIISPTQYSIGNYSGASGMWAADGCWWLAIGY